MKGSNLMNNNNNQNQNTEAQETTKKNINWTGVLKVTGTFILGGAVGAGAMYLYEKHNADNNNTPNAESAFI